MRYYVQNDNEGKIIAIGTGLGGVEITETEYNRLLNEIREKAELVNKLYSNEIAIGDVPFEWQKEIQRQVDELVAQQGTEYQQEISADEALNIILGGETE